MKYTLTFCLISLIVCANVCLVFAEAPTTPKILFTGVSMPDRTYEIYIMNPDGSEQLNLTQHRANDVGAVWSPSGEEILFVSDRGGRRDLYLMDPDGSNVRRVFKREPKRNANRDLPAWAPDGKQIVYMHVGWDDGTFIIYTATLGEQEEDFLVNGWYPAWSPDGTQIACSIDERLTLVNVRTKKPKRLLPRNLLFWQQESSWSAVGDKLVFSWNNNPIPPVAADIRVWDAWQAKQTIYIVNRDGTGLQQLVDEAGPYARHPTFSPDGHQVLYTQEANGFLHIFKIDLNSGIRTQLTHRDSRHISGDWFDPAFALPVSPQPHLLTTTWGEVKKK